MALGKTKYKRILTELGYELVESKGLVPDVSEEQICRETGFTTKNNLLTAVWERR